MLNERLGKIVRQAKSAVDAYDFRVELRRNFNPIFTVADDRSGPTTSFYADVGSEIDVGGKVLYLHKNYGKMYSYRELRGIVSKYAATFHMHKRGYAKVISDAVIKNVKEHEDMIHLNIHMFEVLENSSACQLAMEKGYREDIYEMTKMSLKRSKDVVGRRNAAIRDTPQNKVSNLILNSYSIPFRALGDFDYAVDIENTIRDVTSGMGIGDDIFKNYEDFLDILTVKNWATEEVFSDRMRKTIELMKKIVPV